MLPGSAAQKKPAWLYAHPTIIGIRKVWSSYLSFFMKYTETAKGLFSKRKGKKKDVCMPTYKISCGAHLG